MRPGGFSKHAHQTGQQHHDSRYNIFPRMMPEVAFDFPSPDGAVPLQKNRAECTQQSKASRSQDIERGNPPVWICQLQRKTTSAARLHPKMNRQ